MSTSQDEFLADCRARARSCAKIDSCPKKWIFMDVSDGGMMMRCLRDSCRDAVVVLQLMKEEE